MTKIKETKKIVGNKNAIQKLNEIINFSRNNYTIAHTKTYNLAESGISFSFSLVEQEIRYYLHVRT